jgi:hypothetical protein
MSQAPEPDCWLHVDLEVWPSPIAGEGLVAQACVPAGTTVSRLDGRLATWDELRDLFALAAQQPDRPYTDTITVTNEMHLVLSPGSPNGKGNHSCDPTTGGPAPTPWPHAAISP